MMKKQFTLVVMFMVINIGVLSAQSADDIFIIGTSINSPEKTTGLKRLDSFDPKIDESTYSSFFLSSLEKDYYIFFIHNNYKKTERLKYHPQDYMETKQLRYNELLKFNLINADEFIRNTSQKEAWEWAKYVKSSGKRIWIIDENENFSEGSIEYATLTEVYIFETNEPKKVNHPIIEIEIIE